MNLNSTLLFASLLLSTPTFPQESHQPESETTSSLNAATKYLYQEGSRSLKAKLQALSFTKLTDSFTYRQFLEENALLICVDERLISVPDKMRTELMADPNLLKAYRTDRNIAESADSCLKNAKATGSPESYYRCIFQFPYTDAARLALSFLIARAADTGNWKQGAALAKRLLKDYPDHSLSGGELVLFGVLFKSANEKENLKGITQTIKQLKVGAKIGGVGKTPKELELLIENSKFQPKIEKPDLVHFLEKTNKARPPEHEWYLEATLNLNEEPDRSCAAARVYALNDKRELGEEDVTALLELFGQTTFSKGSVKKNTEQKILSRCWRPLSSEERGQLYIKISQHFERKNKSFEYLQPLFKESILNGAGHGELTGMESILISKPELWPPVVAAIRTQLAESQPKHLKNLLHLLIAAGPHAKPVLSQLAPYLKPSPPLEEHNETRVSVLEIMGNVQDESLFEKIWAIASNTEEDDIVRGSALKAATRYATHRDKTTVDAAKILLDHESPLRTRLSAVEAMRESGPMGVTHLISLYNAPAVDSSLKTKVESILPELAGLHPSKVEDILKLYEKNPDSGFDSVLTSLENHKVDRVKIGAMLLRMSRSTTKYHQLKGIQAMGEYLDMAGISERLSELKTDPVKELREAAKTALDGGENPL